MVLALVLFFSGYPYTSLLSSIFVATSHIAKTGQENFEIFTRRKIDGYV